MQKCMTSQEADELEKYANQYINGPEYKDGFSNTSEISRHRIVEEISRKVVQIKIQQAMLEQVRVNYVRKLEEIKQEKEWLRSLTSKLHQIESKCLYPAKAEAEIENKTS